MVRVRNDLKLRLVGAKVFHLHLRGREFKTWRMHVIRTSPLGMGHKFDEDPNF
jgi:hypothetical protein